MKTETVKPAKKLVKKVVKPAENVTKPVKSLPDDFDVLAEMIEKRVRLFAGKPVFTVGAKQLFDTYLAAFPLEERNLHNCSACRHFLKRYGNLVVLVNGNVESLFWNLDYSKVPTKYVAAVQALYREVNEAQITGVFLSKETFWGEVQAEAPLLWTHFRFASLQVYRDSSVSATQAMASKLEDYKMLKQALVEYPISVVLKAVTLLKTEALYRSERVLGVAENFLELQQKLEGIKNEERRDSLVWETVAKAPAGFCHIRSTMIGTLLDDLSNVAFTINDVQNRFAAKMAPSQYQRAQVAPSAGNIAEAERVIAEMKTAGSLDRRYVKIEEIPHFLWRSQELKKKSFAVAGGVFSHLESKQKVEKQDDSAMVVPPQTMTWAKLCRTVLESARTVEVQVPASQDRFMALVTAANKEAPPILQWDREEARNPMSWYYAAGIDAEIQRRVTNAGGMYEGVDIRASLIWNNRDDLDIHCVTPSGEEICFYHKQSRCGGWLDIDMNVHGETDMPVENIRWARGRALVGRYGFYVQNYRNRCRGSVPFRVELEVNGEVFHFEGATYGESSNSNVTVAEFNYVPGQRLASPPRGLRSAQTEGAWNVATGQWVKVNGIVASPNMWGDKPMSQHGQHTFFLLDGCKDTQGVGRGFYTETLKGEYRSVRATLEAYTASAVIAGAEEASACGLGMNNSTPWNLMLRVTSDAGVGFYKIDRWD